MNRASKKNPRYDGHHLVVAFGNAGAEIAAYAERIEADLIVLPSHGRTDLRRPLTHHDEEGGS